MLCCAITVARIVLINKSKTHLSLDVTPQEQYAGSKNPRILQHGLDPGDEFTFNLTGVSNARC